MFIEFDPDADAVFIRFRARDKGETGENLDERRIVKYDAKGEPVGVELLGVSQGIDLAGLPEADAIASALRAFPRLAA